MARVGNFFKIRSNMQSLDAVIDFGLSCIAENQVC